MVVATRVLLIGFVLVLVKVVVLIEISASAFLETLVFLPTSEVLMDLFFLVAVMAGLLVTLFLVEIAVLGLVTVLDFVIVLLVLLPAGRAFLGAAIFLTISEVLTDVIVLVLVVDGCLVTAFLVGVEAFGFVTVLDFVIVLLVLLAAGQAFLGAAIFLTISEVLTDVIALVLVVDGCLVTAFFVGVEAFGFVTVLDFVIVLLVLLAGVFRVAFGLVVFISLVLVVDILLAAKLFRR